MKEGVGLPLESSPKVGAFLITTSYAITHKVKAERLGFDPKVHFGLRTSHCGFIDGIQLVNSLLATQVASPHSFSRIAKAAVMKADTIDRNWSLTRDLAVPWLHIQSSTCG